MNYIKNFFLIKIAAFISICAISCTTYSIGSTTISSSLSALLEHTQSFPVQLTLALLLGFLLSLTPCIFPMIPITIGILQGTGGNSRKRSFFIASAYTLGVSLTFASLGLLVASGGIAFGEFARSPFFVLSLVTFLTYLALSMFGLYDMHVPAFLKKRAQKSSNQGSLVSAFIFGALSGTIASPCLSPGLALILTIAATLGNKILAFLLLFTFGVGSALPLLIIGTFSSSLQVFPKAGMWMIEVKKLFGFMLFAVCFYYLESLISHHILLWLIAEFLCITGLWYFSAVAKHDSHTTKLFKKIMGFVLLVGSGFFFVSAYKTQNTHKPELENSVEAQAENISWHNTYEQAYKQAEEQNKKLFVVYTTDFCPSCLVLEKKILQKPIVHTVLQNFVCVKISELTALKSLLGEHAFLPTPTMLIVDPVTKTVVKQWQNGVPKEQTVEDFVQELTALL